MADYLHGVYSQIKATGSKAAVNGSTAIIYVGTAPVNQVAGGADNVNKPILVENIAQARAAFGYSSDWAKYTLCEAFTAHFENNGVGPLVIINVLDPVTHKAASGGTAGPAPENGRAYIYDAEDIILDSVKVTGKTLGTDYSIAYEYSTKRIVLTERSTGSLGTGALTISFDKVDPSKVTAANVIGSSAVGNNTGLYAVKSVYQTTRTIPSFLVAPGWSSNPEVHKAMAINANKVNKHWDLYMLVDMPVMDNATPITLTTAATWKTNNGYNLPNETVYFPLATGTDGKVYHLSTLAAANLQQLLIDQDGIPYKTASNTDAPIIKNLYFGAASTTNYVYDDSLINEYLNKHGIASACYVGGRWVIWGAHCADYEHETGDIVAVAETNRMMLYYLSNSFQHRRWGNVDKPITQNDIKAIVAEEQARLDALIKIGALIYGEVYQDTGVSARAALRTGDLSFVFNVTTTPLAKSLTAVVQWTDEGFVTYFN